MDVSRISSLGWHAHITLCQGVASTYDWFKEANIVDHEADD
jgi:nucleoside-diphosphate-sugar epimerase